MGANDYAFAVARIRVLEKKLLDDAAVAQMIASSDEKQIFSYLSERGWSVGNGKTDTDSMLRAESEKTKELIRSLGVEPEVLKVFSYPDIFHNLKAAVKTVCTGVENPGIFVDNEEFGRDEILPIVREKRFERLPENMRDAAKEAYESLLHTGNGQIADIVIDRAALTAIEKDGADSPEMIVRDWAAQYVAVADIRIAVRCAKMKKRRDFIERAIAPCGKLDTERLIRAASEGTDAVIGYLSKTEFAAAAEAISESPSAFERWCDDAVIDKMRPQRHNPFTAGPVIAYYLARENEIRMVRIILTAKANGLPEEAIRERARKMYV